MSPVNVVEHATLSGQSALRPFIAITVFRFSRRLLTDELLQELAAWFAQSFAHGNAIKISYTLSLTDPQPLLRTS